MFKAASWLQAKKSNANASTHSLDSLAEPQNLESAMRGTKKLSTSHTNKPAIYIMNDDVDAAEAGLSEGNSSFHKLGKGVVTFLKATLGFEQNIMREASERLAEAEASASADHRRAQREPHAYRSSIYPPGSEFALCHAQSQLMSAVVGVLNESLTESLKGFYKLRKAYITLDVILQAEVKYMKGRSGGSVTSTRRNSADSLRSNRSARSMKGMPGGFGDERTAPAVSSGHRTRTLVDPVTNQVKEYGATTMQGDGAADNDEEDEFFDADEGHEGLETPTHNVGQVDSDGMHEKMVDLSAQPNGIPKEAPRPPPQRQLTTTGMLDHDPGSDVFANPIDTFIHSGSNLCFGLLLLLISLIPPAFGKLLFIIGFHGDRERGIKMLWQSSKFRNINGAMAGLILLGYYNGLVGFCDILPDNKDGDENLEGYPKQRCEVLLAEMRTRYPKSHLWLLEEARMEAANKRLDKAIELLSGDTKSPLKQVEALAMFEKSLNAMYSHRYELCAESFIKCVSLNNWSHALYYYIAGSAHIELYRRLKYTNSASATKHASKAVEYLREVPKHTGKKRFMARQLPFDVFVYRKIQKWEQRAKDWGVEFVDAVGISPIEEMIYFWNGYKRMDEHQLDISMAALNWSPNPNLNPTWPRETLDENAVHAVLRAAVLRNFHHHAEARTILKQEVLVHDRALFKGHLRDDWTCPTAHYEMAANFWSERDGSGSGREGERVRECGEWLDKVARWEGYDLDARIGLKVTTAQDTLKKYGA
ncbi:MAG: Mitochondrial outer membrane protein iml2 [Pleopsidium flavum]|nr:MAG: Mitochondrial outer membrane protein iml2 [Pleopsidium flavum]